MIWLKSACRFGADSKRFEFGAGKNNVTAIESLGRIFDPNLHKVVQEIDDPENRPERSCRNGRKAI